MHYQKIKFLLVSLMLIFLISGCADTLSQFNAKIKSKSNEMSGVEQQATQSQATTPTGTAVRIGAWNIQRFGYEKSHDQNTMTVIKGVINTYDLLALQEIQDVSGTAVMPIISSSIPVGYRMVTSPSLGRTTYMERYVVIYDPSDFNYIESYTYNDAQDVFEREPFIARFSRNSIDFTLVVCHIKPGDAYREIRELERVATEVVAKYGDYDVILLGDMNGDCQYFSSPLFTNYYPIINYGEDTTVGNSSCAYDRIFISNTLKPRMTNGGVDRLATITPEISDHYPVFCTFVMDN